MKKEFFAVLIILCLFTLFFIGCTSTADEEVNTEAEIIADEEGISVEQTIKIMGQASKKVQGGGGGDRTVTWLSCSDTDGGKDYYNLGKITATYSYRGRESTKTNQDVCKGNKIKEYYCDGNEYSAVLHACENGCKNGVCLQETPPGTPPIEDRNCSEPDGGLNVEVASICKDDQGIYGDGCHYHVELGKTALDEYYCDAENRCALQVYVCEDHGYQDCLDNICRKKENKTGFIYGETIPAEAEFWVDDKYVGLTPKTVVADVGIRMVTFKKQGYKIYWENVEVFEGKTTYVYATLVKNETNCTDTDGGKNVFVFGTCIDPNLPEPVVDNCSLEDPRGISINEAYCDTTGCAVDYLACQHGYECSEGACVPVQSETNCTDTDYYGENFRKRLGTKGTCTDETGVFTDYCLDDLWLRDYYCWPVFQYPQSCGYGDYRCSYFNFTGCSDGACVGGDPI